jgi:hypothetical protein
MVKAPHCVDYYPGWVANPERLFAELHEEIVWEQHAVTLYGRTMPTPRLTAWMGDGSYRYSGIVNEPSPWPRALTQLRQELCRQVGVDFNSALPTSIGTARTPWAITVTTSPSSVPERPLHRSASEIDDGSCCATGQLASAGPGSWGHGDLLVMRDESQSDYAHAVPKTSRPVGPRMNLTFRCFHPSEHA